MATVSPATVDSAVLLDFLVELLNTPSPTGLAEPALAFTEQTLKASAAALPKSDPDKAAAPSASPAKSDDPASVK